MKSNLSKKKRRIRKAKRQILTIICAPYYMLHYVFLKVIRSIKTIFSVKAKLNNIINGWANYTVENPVVEAVAERRAKACSECKHAVKMKIKIKDKKISDISGLMCDKCGCPLSAKTRSMDDHCPLKKW